MWWGELSNASCHFNGNNICGFSFVVLSCPTKRVIFSAFENVGFQNKFSSIFQCFKNFIKCPYQTDKKEVEVLYNVHKKNVSSYRRFEPTGGYLL